ncbi:ferredoxin [Microbacterium sp. A588]
MAFAIGSDCIDVMDRSCVTVCPVDCIYEGKRRLYINPIECIDCGACEPVCPVEAIRFDEDIDDNDPRLEENASFFLETLPGRDTPLGRAGGARKTGPLGTDIPQVAPIAGPKSAEIAWQKASVDMDPHKQESACVSE